MLFLRRSVPFLAALLLAVPACVESEPDTASGLWAVGAPASVADQYIVELVPGASAHGRAAAFAAEHGASVLHVYQHTINGFAFRGSAQAAEALARNPWVLSVTPDAVAQMVGKPDKLPKPPKDPPPPPPAEVVPWGIDRVGGPFDGTTTSNVAWVLDTGIDPDNADLNIDFALSKNFTTLRGKPPKYDWRDGNGHGTHVAGTIAAIDNDIEVVGVAAGATVVALRVLDDGGSGAYSGIIAAIDYMAANAQPGDVANMSMGGGAYQPLDDAILAAAHDHGIKFAVAAGNESSDTSLSSPARIVDPDVYVVSAIDSSDVFAYFSNYGDSVDFAAPGYYIESLAVGGGTATMSGTSMATPHVAGLLLIGPIASDGFAIDDPDGNPDPIAHIF